ncbi:hypothetical protein BKA70DRAFT_1440293 [Coprinopsis sp. MPI-PUGE-AT-0042]|nr:hypothetical protein BKA70DRAFT_1440293 [Coprinopsis sp. MPI-PUGE-AT-0042]
MSIFTFHQLVVNDEIVTTTLINTSSFPNSDLIILAQPPINELVVVKWPIVNGKLIHPKDFAKYLLECGLVWGCFCGFGSRFRSCMIGFDGTKYVAKCWSDKPAMKGCNFYLDLDFIYTRTKEVSEYPHLLPGHVDAAAYHMFVTRFEVTRKVIRAHDAICNRQPYPLLAQGWIGELGTGVKQCRLRPKSRLLMLFMQWWSRLRQQFSSIDVGIDGV